MQHVIPDLPSGAQTRAGIITITPLYSFIHQFLLLHFLTHPPALSPLPPAASSGEVMGTGGRDEGRHRPTRRKEKKKKEGKRKVRKKK